MINADLEKDNNIDGWIDKTMLMSAQEKANLEQNVRPVRSALAKVINNQPESSCSYCFGFPEDMQVGL